MEPYLILLARSFVTEQLAYASLSMLTAGLTDRRIIVASVVEIVDRALTLLGDDVAHKTHADAYWQSIRASYVAIAAGDPAVPPERPH